MIDEIAVVMHPMWVDKMNEIVAKNRWKKLHKVLSGGKERYMSTVSAIKAYCDGDECNMIFHDAARPLVSNRIICDVVHTLEKYDAVGVAVRVTDTMFVVKNDTVISVPDRNTMYRAQTPQAFKLSVIKKAYDLALADSNITSTDDCGTVVHYMPNVSIRMVEGDEQNIKLTYNEDIETIEHRITYRMKDSTNNNN